MEFIEKYGKDIEELFRNNNLDDYKTHKRYNFLGIKINIKKSRYEMELDKIKLLCLQIQKKLAMTDNVCYIKNIKFYVPNYPFDFIQKTLVDNGKFFEQDILEKISKYIPKNAVIVDIGANIGNHSIYWGGVASAEKIYAFEPILSTFDILRKNIELNHLENIVKPFNIGLSNEKSFAGIATYHDGNIGGTQIEKTHSNSDIMVDKLDNINIEEDRIDFIKIDVEKHEYFTLQGMENTLKKYKPVLFIEVFEKNYEKVAKLLNSYNYVMTEEFEGFNYIFEYKK